MENNKQQTAVEILCGKLAMKLGIPQAITFYIDHQEEIKEAKEMEKKQAIRLYYEYELYVMMNESVVMTFGQFYKQTYGGGEQ
jgi:hypothetical protein